MRRDRRARQLYDLLAPYERIMGTGAATLVIRSVAQSPSRFASLTHGCGRANQHFERVRQAHERLRGPDHLAETQRDLAELHHNAPDSGPTWPRPSNLSSHEGTSTATRITADLYQHASETMQKEAAAKLGAAFLGQ